MPSLGASCPPTVVVASPVSQVGSTGTPVWIKSFGGSRGDFCSGIAVDAAGSNVYVTGKTSSIQTTFDSYRLGTVNTYGESFIAKLSTSAGTAQAASLHGFNSSDSTWWWWRGW